MSFTSFGGNAARSRRTSELDKYTVTKGNQPWQNYYYALIFPRLLVP